MRFMNRVGPRAIGRIFLAAFLSLAMTGVVLGQSVPQLLNFQGRLTTDSGQPMTTGDYAVTFRIYDAPSGGTLQWGPQIFDGVAGAGHGGKVPVVQGYFNVILGPSDVEGDALVTAFAGPDRWMEITLGTNAPILPRQQVLSSPYALTAGRGGGAVGDVVASLLDEVQFKQERPGEAWVPCDGRDVTTSRLHALTGRTRVADLQGRFPLGRDALSVNRVQETPADSIGEVGGAERHTLTMAEMPAHTHSQEIARGFPPYYYRPDVGGTADSNEWHWGGETGSAGGGLPHSNMPPYLVVMYYCRIN